MIWAVALSFIVGGIFGVIITAVLMAGDDDRYDEED